MLSMSASQPGLCVFAPQSSRPLPLQLYPEAEIKLSRITAIVLGIIYILYLVFQLVTHADMFVSEQTNEAMEEEEEPMLSSVAATGTRVWPSRSHGFGD